jgi:SAM-dependent methyltransferase
MSEPLPIDFTQQPESAAPSRWDAGSIGRFWDYWALRTDLHDQYFTHMVGAGISRYAELAGVLGGRALDYGCGPGYLVEHLLGRGNGVAGLDFSAKSVDTLNARLARRSGWLGATAVTRLPSPLAPESFDVVFCIETLEHLDDAWLAETLAEIRRLVRPGGAVVVSTPNREDLRRNQVFCPFCVSEFHAFQHVRSFGAPALRETLASAGFEVLHCAPTDFARFQAPPQLLPLRTLSPQRLVSWLAHRVAALRGGRGFASPLFRNLEGNGGPHLVAVARRSRGA